MLFRSDAGVAHPAAGNAGAGAKRLAVADAHGTGSSAPSQVAAEDENAPFC